MAPQGHKSLLPTELILVNAWRIFNVLAITLTFGLINNCPMIAQGGNIEPTTLTHTAGAITLSYGSNGIDGKLILLTDNRLPEGMSAWEYLDSVGIDSPLQNGVLIILSQKGDTIFTEQLEKPTAWFDFTDTIKDSPSWTGITIDYTSGIGSYAGPITSFLRVKGARIEWLQATDTSTNEPQRIYLMRSLKTDWRLLRTDPPTILEAACRPDFEKGDNAFQIIYTRYSVIKEFWIKSTRVESGFLEFESDDDFPQESKFPK